MQSDGIALAAKQASAPDNGQTPATERPVPQRPLLGFTAAEAADILDVARTTIYDWLKGDAPVLTSRKIGKSHYIHRESLYALLDAESAGVGS